MIFLTSTLGPSIPTISGGAVAGVIIIGGGVLYLAWQVVQLVRGK